MSATYVLNEDQLILNNYENVQTASHDIFYLQNDSKTFLVNGSLVNSEGQPVIIQDDENIDEFCIDEDSQSQFLITLAHEKSITPESTSLNSNLMQFWTESNFTNGAQDSSFLVIENDELSPRLSPIQHVNITPEIPNNTGIIKHENLMALSDKPFETFISNSLLKNKNNIDFSQFKGRDLTTGEALSLESYLEKKLKKLKKEREVADYLEKQKIYREKQLEKSYRTLINKKIEIGKTPDGRKVVGKIITIKKPDNKEKTSEPNTEKVNYQMFTTYDDHNFMAKSTIEDPDYLQDELTLNHNSDAEILDSIDINEILEDHNYTDLLFENDNSFGFDNLLCHHNYSKTDSNIEENTIKIDEEQHKLKKHENLRVKLNENGGKMSYNYSFECIFCKRQFSRLATLQKHIEILHNGQKPTYTCSFCGCSYHYASSLTRHITQNHIEKKNTKFKHNLDDKNHNLNVQETEIITLDSILMEEDGTCSESDQNLVDCDNKKNCIELFAVNNADSNSLEKMGNEIMEIPVLEVDIATLLEMEKCGQIVETTEIIDNTENSENVLCQMDDEGNLYSMENFGCLRGKVI